MKFKVKDMDIATGGVHVVILNKEDAAFWDLHPMDRILIRKGVKKTVAVLDIAESKKAVPKGSIGLFEEVLDHLQVKHGTRVDVTLARKPASVKFIKKKLDREKLTYPETLAIVKDIVDDKLTDIELTSYVTANYMNGITIQEVADLTRAMKETGVVLKFRKRQLIDLHCIGGVPGNRTTMIVVPIIVAAGLAMPKTSSRAITSPAGTADTMEVLTSVSLSPAKLKRIISTVGGFIIWGGSINLAPADDKIIDVEHPLSIDAEGQMLASIMAKKSSVSATHLLIDIPVGPGSKVEDPKDAYHLKHRFESLGRKLGIKVKVITTDGSEPIGNGIGPVLEAKDCIWVLKGNPKGPQDLREKSLQLAGIILEFAGKARKGKGYALAEELLNAGKAWDAMKKMIKAQGGKVINADELRLARYQRDFTAAKNCTIRHLDNIAIAKAARIAGAPKDKEAGLFIHKHKGDYVKKGEPILTIYSDNKEKLEFAFDILKHSKCVITT